MNLEDRIRDSMKKAVKGEDNDLESEWKARIAFIKRAIFRNISSGSGFNNEKESEN